MAAVEELAGRNGGGVAPYERRGDDLRRRRGALGKIGKADLDVGRDLIG